MTSLYFLFRCSKPFDLHEIHFVSNDILPFAVQRCYVLTDFTILQVLNDALDRGEWLLYLPLIHSRSALLPAVPLNCEYIKCTINSFNVKHILLKLFYQIASCISLFSVSLCLKFDCRPSSTP